MRRRLGERGGMMWFVVEGLGLIADRVEGWKRLLVLIKLPRVVLQALVGFVLQHLVGELR